MLCYDPMLITDISWEQLEAWAGDEVVARGRGYKNRVNDLKLRSDTHLVATVEGRSRYHTEIWLEEDGELVCSCSCPYNWVPCCKHGIATLLLYLDKLQQGVEVELLLEEEQESVDLIDTSLPTIKAALKEKVRKLKKAELQSVLLSLLDESPEIVRLLDHKLTTPPTSRTDLQRQVAKIRKEIERVSEEHAWQNHWDNEGSIPDYSRIEEQLQQLLGQGYYQQILDLGEYLLQRGIEQIEQSDDDGELGWEISSCLAVVLQALKESPMPAVERLLYFWQMQEREDYGLLCNIEVVPVEEVELSEAEWAQVAQHYSQQLQQLEKPKRDRYGGWRDSYQRSQLLKRLVRAENGAGQPQQATEWLIQDLPYTEEYVALVQQLQQQGELKQAMQWAQKGFQQTQGRLAGVANQLRELLIELNAEYGEPLQALALEMDHFFEYPQLQQYLKIRSLSENRQFWSTLRAGIIEWLQSGQLPQQQADWPLPESGLTQGKRRSWGRPAHYGVLIDIALHEKEIHQALQWYEASCKEGRNHCTRCREIAEATWQQQLEPALTIWRYSVEQQIAKVKPKAYREARPDLMKIEKLYRHHGKTEAFSQWIQQLRTTHKAKRRLIEVLDGVEERRGRILS
jgi:uncharacterized Zn finger protein